MVNPIVRSAGWGRLTGALESERRLSIYPKKPAASSGGKLVAPHLDAARASPSLRVLA